MMNTTMQCEFGLYIFSVANNDDNFADIFSMPLHMKALTDDSLYSHLKKTLLAILKMLNRAIASKRNHKFTKR